MERVFGRHSWDRPHDDWFYDAGLDAELAPAAAVRYLAVYSIEGSGDAVAPSSGVRVWVFDLQTGGMIAAGADAKVASLEDAQRDAVLALAGELVGGDFRPSETGRHGY
jgi:hypothetical protein